MLGAPVRSRSTELGRPVQSRPQVAAAVMLPYEPRLVALTAGGAQNDAAIADLLARRLDWAHVERVAERERAVAQVVRRVSVLSDSQIGTEPERLLKLARVSDFQLGLLHSRLATVVRGLAELGIDVVLLKGAGLAHSVYASPLDRPMGDMDLLVHPDCAEDAWQFAVRNGWMRRRDIPIERGYEGHQHLAPLEDARGVPVGLEFHTELFTRQAPFTFAATDIWKESREVQVGGVRAFVPAAHHQLLHASLHFAWSHEMMFGGWRTLRDVDVLVASGTVQWESFVSAARVSRGASCGYWTLRLARDMAGTRVPEYVLDELAPLMSERLRAPLARHFALQALGGGVVCPSVACSRVLWQLGVRPGKHGHGKSRPWYDNEEWPRDAVPRQRNTLAQRSTASVRRITQLGGYLVNISRTPAEPV